MGEAHPLRRCFTLNALGILTSVIGIHSVSPDLFNLTSTLIFIELI